MQASTPSAPRVALRRTSELSHQGSTKAMHAVRRGSTAVLEKGATCRQGMVRQVGKIRNEFSRFGSFEQISVTSYDTMLKKLSSVYRLSHKSEIKDKVKQLVAPRGIKGLIVPSSTPITIFWDVWTAIWLVFTALVTPFEVAVLRQQTVHDALFWIIETGRSWRACAWSAETDDKRDVATLDEKRVTTRPSSCRRRRPPTSHTSGRQRSHCSEG